MIFFPLAPLHATPADWGLDYEDVRFVTEEGVGLHGWLIRAPTRAPAKRSSRPNTVQPNTVQPSTVRPSTVLLLHGNAGNISHRRDSVTILTDLGLDVFIIDYRGYGQSEGSPSEQGLYADAAAAWRWLTETRNIEPQQIVVFGRSLGGAVAVQLAAQTGPAALIVESSFDRLQSLADVHYPLLARVIPLRYRFPAVEQIAAVRCPVLVLHSPDDRIVPYALGQRLYEAAPEPKLFVELRGGHNEGFLQSQPAYQQSLDAFLDGLPAARRPQDD
ncbi:hypothetical protein CKO40_10595 [Halochromatium glycolicum]|uniref:Serine aminopeptidase S33 domain-containing protein n=2 Tax=Halochromatium glycolicum TaxID=85075 RepID=A0AAJ0XAB5_9GAMM|nr:hypothetical protein [Halochromatium glycolicum]